MSTTTDMDTISERLRMALLDIGEPPDAVTGIGILCNEDGCGGPGATAEGAWRAFSIVMPDTTPCFACWDAGTGCHRDDGCQADRPFTMDCEVAR